MSETLNQYVSEGYFVGKHKLSGCVKELRKYGRSDSALEVLEWMEKKGISYGSREHALRLDLISIVKGVHAAEEYFQNLPPTSKDESTYGALLSCYCKHVMEDKALALFKKMEELNFLSCGSPFNNLMALYMRMNQPEKVPPLVQEMKKRSIHLSTLTYNILMNSYASLNDIEAVERVMRENESESNWTKYSNLAAIYIKASLFEKAEIALRKLEEVMKNPKREAYHYMITMYASTNNLGEVKRVWNSLKLAFPATNNISYLFMLQALRKLKDVDGLTKCFEEWESSFSSFDIRLSNVAISAYLNQGMYKEASLVFDGAIKRCEGPFFVARESFMVYFLKSHQVNLALDHLDAAVSELKGKEWHLQPATAEAFLECFEGEKDVDAAEGFCRIMKVFGGLSSNIYHLLLKTYIAAGKMAPEMRQRLEEDHIEISSELENLLQRVCPE